MEYLIQSYPNYVPVGSLPLHCDEDKVRFLLQFSSSILINSTHSVAAERDIRSYRKRSVTN